MLQKIRFSIIVQKNCKVNDTLIPGRYDNLKQKKKKMMDSYISLHYFWRGEKNLWG